MKSQVVERQELAIKKVQEKNKFLIVMIIVEAFILLLILSVFSFGVFRKISNSSVDEEEVETYLDFLKKMVEQQRSKDRSFVDDDFIFDKALEEQNSDLCRNILNITKRELCLNSFNGVGE